MPLYEYLCSDWRTRFTALRAMSEASTPIACEACEGEHTVRVLSTFAVFTSKTETGGSSSSGGCACGGACSCSHSLN